MLQTINTEVQYKYHLIQTLKMANGGQCSLREKITGQNF